MFRAVVLVVASLLLSGCWGAERQLFTRGDWVQPAGLEGHFVSENPAGEQMGTVNLVRRADGMIDGTATRKDDEKPQTTATGFVAIPGGSGRYFLMVQRAPTAEAAAARGGEFYLIGRWRDDRLEAFWPQCAGTPDLPGMKREKVEVVNEAVCTFASKEVVLRAALQAERELETKRMFEPQLLGRLKRAEVGPAPEPEAEPED